MRGVGVKKRGKFADVLCGRPLMANPNSNPVPVSHFLVFFIVFFLNVKKLCDWV
jgi:hypothetical protein